MLSNILYKISVLPRKQNIKKVKNHRAVSGTGFVWRARKAKGLHP